MKFFFTLNVLLDCVDENEQNMVASETTVYQTKIKWSMQLKANIRPSTYGNQIYCVVGYKSHNMKKYGTIEVFFFLK